MKISKYNIIKESDNKILVYNSYTKSSIYLEKGSDISAFESIEAFNKLDKETQELLFQEGFVVEDDRDEFSEIKYIYEQKYFDTSFFNIVLVPTLACNFKCPYCCEKDFKCGKENIKKYFEVLKKYAAKNFHLHNTVQISLFGGEPLLCAKESIEFLDWVAQDAKTHGYEYFTSVVTNGSLLTSDIFKKLLEHNLYALQITIDSDKENHDSMRIFKDNRPSFDLLINKINELLPLSIKYEDFKFIVRINLNNTTVEKVQKSLSKINENNRKYIHLLIRAIYKTHAYHEDNTNSLNDLKPYFDMGKKIGFNILQEKYNYQTCEACGDRKFFNLMPDLSIWKCINDLGYKDSCVGRINEDGDIELKPEKVVKWYKNCTSAFIDEECMKCKLLPDCLGGCPLYKCKHGKKSCRSFDMVSRPFTY